MGKLEHIVKFKACHGGSHGAHGLNICFYVKGERGAIQFILYTGWLPQRVGRDYIESINSWLDPSTTTHFPIPAYLDYHSPIPMYDGQSQVTDSCDLLDGKPCYYDRSRLQAVGAMYTLVNGGGEALWEFLESVYAKQFEGGESIKPAEYPKASR